MHPVKNPTQYALETLEHQLVDAITETMYSVLDNGDRPDKRIDAIIGLHAVMVDWKAGKDFQCAVTGQYLSVRDVVPVQVWVRYAKRTKLVRVH